MTATPSDIREWAAMIHKMVRAIAAGLGIEIGDDLPTLSDRQRKMLDFIESYIARHGFAPSVREIVEGTEITTTSVVNYHLGRLEAMGYLSRHPYTARSIVLTRADQRRDDHD